jgi:outer membrane receptor protein involved in Fe transport
MFGVTVYLASGIARFPVSAEPAGNNADAPPSTALQEIVVTAEKRSEPLQKVPLSVVAFNQQSLRETGVQDFSSLAARIAGVTLNSAGPGRSSYSIRGIASIGGNAPTTGLYIDETPILPSGGDGANASIDPDLFDLARIEVLRGPQGTLYGASSMGGTIRLITNQPNLTKVEAAVKIEGSDTDHGSGNARIDGMLNIPLIKDRVALRLVGTYKDFSGFIDRYVGVWVPNPSPQPGFPAYPISPAQPSEIIRDVNTEKRTSLRATLKIAATDAFSITPSVWIQDLRAGAPSNYDVATGQSGGPLVQRRPFNVPEAYSDHFVLSNLTMNYDLGFGSLLSTTSYMRRQETTPDDETEALELNLPQGQFVANAYAPTVTTREFSQELRFSFSAADSTLSGVVGGYFNNSNRHYYVDYVIPNYDGLFRNSPSSIALFGPGPLDNTNYSQHGDYSPKQSAAFTELNYQVTSALRATAGLRWYNLEYTTVRYEDGLSNGGPSLSTGTAKNSGLNPKAELSYQATPDQLYYTSASRGVRPGGVNTSNLAQKGCGQDYGPYGPDSLWNYEIGAKTGWLGGAMTINAAAYYIRWNDIQQGRTLPCSYQITENAGKAVVHGAEVEFEAKVSEHIQLGAGLGYTKAVLAVDAPSVNGIKGQQLENVPLWNGNASAKYLFSLAPGYDGFLRADGQHVGASYPDFDRTDPATFQRAYTVLDMRGGITHGAWEANLFVSNAFDKQAALSRFISDNYDASTRSRIFTNRPRTIGLSFEWRL